MKRHEKFLLDELGIEFKAAMYFYSILAFYFAYQLINSRLQAEIIFLLEMLAATYAMGFVQVFLLRNFDETEQLTYREVLKVLGCSAVYALISYLCGWFGRDLLVTAFFFVFMLICYGCTWWAYSFRRRVTTKEMNDALQQFKKKKQGEENYDSGN